MNAASFQSTEELSNYQAERELREALAVQSMTPAERYQWLANNWGRLQDEATTIFANVLTQRSAAARCYRSMKEKNRFDENRELEIALQISTKSCLNDRQ